MRHFIRLLLGVVFLTGCAHYPVNAPETHYDPAQGYRFSKNASGDNTNSLFLCLTFSGGGTRAAALSYGVLQKLRDVTITWKGTRKRLLDEVDCISSVSGGSFTAAYYGLFGERLFQDFRSRFLERNVQGELEGLAFNPVNWPRLASPDFSRSDLAAELYGETIFDGRTFADLSQSRQRPFVIINATNLASGERFGFTQEQFDFLGSDLRSYPVARAVAASSAFPILLSPISLYNYPSPADYAVPQTVTNGLKDYDSNRRRYQWALNRAAYLDKQNHPYVHLMDGGLADNIGLRAVENEYRNGFINELINDGQIEKLVVIVVNARTEDQDVISRKESPPKLETVAYKTSTIALDNYSFETIEMMKDLQKERLQAQQAVADCQQKLDRCPAKPQLPKFPVVIDPYVIEINFEAIPDKTCRDRFLQLPTNFRLSQEQVQALIDISSQLLDRSPRFKELLASMGYPLQEKPFRCPL
jgi:predicted acylesterase/phospholipase RssA